MHATADPAGVFFAALVIVLTIPFAVIYVRRRGELDPEDRMTLGVQLAAAFLLGVVKAVRSLGWLSDNAAYWTLNYSLAALFFAMFWRFTWKHRRQKS